jgi:hypothetical protein
MMLMEMKMNEKEKPTKIKIMLKGRE